MRFRNPAEAAKWWRKEAALDSRRYMEDPAAARCAGKSHGRGQRCLITDEPKRKRPKEYYHQAHFLGFTPL